MLFIGHFSFDEIDNDDDDDDDDGYIESKPFIAFDR